jgi:hypothetical protein
MKKKLKSYFILILFCFFSLIGFVKAPLKFYENLDRCEKTLSALQCNCFVIPPLVNNDIRSDDEKKTTFSNLIPALLTIGAIAICFNSFVFITSRYFDLSYWGQKIQVLSSRSHPPTHCLKSK